MNAQLWAKGLALDEVIHRFTVGDDPVADVVLLPYDALGSAAHARTLAHSGLMTAADADALVELLDTIAVRARQDGLKIAPEQEDAHTAIEVLLTAQLGDVGKRIHLGRSRNDQVILALRLYMRDAVLDIGARMVALAHAFLEFARTHKDTSMPGYTHLRHAMPSSFGLWGVAFAAGLVEELGALQAVYVRLDHCPLGAAAGFGTPLPLDRDYTAALLGFSALQISPVDVINSRGRHELALVNAFASTGLVMEKFLWDVALYSTSEFGFLRLPDAFTTGSSIMPQKRNPDVVELARARCRELRGYVAMIQELASGLPSNYHRDLQLLKRPLFSAVERTREWLDVLIRLVPALQVNDEIAAAACGDELYAAQQAYALVREGVPFRDAYRKVADEIRDGRFRPDRSAPDAAHLGSIGDPGIERIETGLGEISDWLETTRTRLLRCEEQVWSSNQTGVTG
ncbi:MAG TPA: argininosuccinate lyase [Gammaproteobacteria bacterium]|nr:argininosuccinate lyase [Gammaproteobacteria bacterium]